MAKMEGDVLVAGYGCVSPVVLAIIAIIVGVIIVCAGIEIYGRMKK